MSIDTSGLDNWPDPGQINSNAAALRFHGGTYHDTTEAAHSTWQGLDSCYETDHTDKLVNALEPARVSGRQAASGCGAVAAAMASFGDNIGNLLPRRSSLRAEADTFNAKTPPGPDAPADEITAHEDEKRRIEQAIKALIQEYRTAISSCCSQLGGIDADGVPMDSSPAWWNGPVRDSYLGFLVALNQTSKVDGLRTTTHLDFNYGSHSCRVPVWVSYQMGKSNVDFRTWVRSGERVGVLKHFGSGMAAMFVGPPPGKLGAATPVSKPKVLAYGPYGRHAANSTRPATFAAKGSPPAPTPWSITSGQTARSVTGGTKMKIRGLGHAALAVSVYANYDAEYQKADARHKQEFPMLSDEERRSKTTETAAVRTASQVAVGAAATAAGTTAVSVVTAAATGAAFGSTVPIAGTLVGLAVGAAVGLAMSYDFDGDGRNMNDAVGDGGETVWDWAKSPFTEDTPAG